MKTLFTLLVAVATASISMAQVDVTFKVDITDYLSAGNTLDPTGMRIAGDFATIGAENQGNAMADWSPSDAQSAMTDEGGNVWSITITYPAGAVGDTQSYKFVNGDWGVPGVANEGGDSSNIAIDGCGSDDGSGNINRELIIPSADVGYQFCWEECTQCDGSDPLILGVEMVKIVSDFHVSPNPVTSGATIHYTLSESIESLDISIYSILGQRIKTIYNGAQAHGTHQTTWNLTNEQGAEVENGIYFYTLTNGVSRITQKVVLTR